MKTKTAKLFTSTAFGILTILLTIGIAYAQMKPWNAISGASRFQGLTSFNSEAVLDRETGLIWQQVPTGINANATNNVGIAANTCFAVSTGGKLGWRLPTVEELSTLHSALTTTPYFSSVPTNSPYWSYTTSPVFTTRAFVVDFAAAIGGNTLIPAEKNGSTNYYYWCVRGGSIQGTGN